MQPACSPAGCSGLPLELLADEPDRKANFSAIFSCTDLATHLSRVAEPACAAEDTDRATICGHTAVKHTAKQIQYAKPYLDGTTIIGGGPIAQDHIDKCGVTRHHKQLRSTPSIEGCLAIGDKRDGVRDVQGVIQEEYIRSQLDTSRANFG